MQLIKWFQNIPLGWHSLFFLIASLNMSLPLLLNHIEMSNQTLQELNQGLNDITQTLEVKDGQLIAETQSIQVSDDLTIRILESASRNERTISFQKDYLEINLDGENNRIAYEQQMTKESLLNNIRTRVGEATLLSRMAITVIFILMNMFIFIAMIIAAAYLMKARVNFSKLFRLLNPVYLVGGTFAILTSLLLNNYLVIYFIAIGLIGILFAVVLKELMNQATTDFYFGKGDNLNELH